MAARRRSANPLALAVLAVLSEQPRHPYEIAQTLRRRGKDESIKIKYGSLYTVVRNLEKRSLVAVAGVQRAGRRPERTLYELTDQGREELQERLSELVAVPVREYPRFESALSLLPVLAPDEAMRLLRERLLSLEVTAASLRGSLRRLYTDLPRVFLLETEYQARMVEAEADWTRELLAELARGDVSGLEQWRELHRDGRVPDQWQRMEAQEGEDQET